MIRNVPMRHLLPSLSIFILTAAAALCPPPASAESYHDILLTENRVCKTCRWEVADDRHVRLINRNGDRIVVENQEVLGVDDHPFWRKAIYKSVHGIGLPGPIIVPSAFDEGRDFVCKYCNEIGP